jgi:hypothetical protein
MYNLNDSNFDAKQGVAIFNDGKAGLVDNVSVSVYKKKPEDKENAPDYKLVFKDVQLLIGMLSKLLNIKLLRTKLENKVLL